uniref:Uncharacterized protein n=1 Tax=Coturnix japonica TaxID=93934 RepID=A0A8C2TT73_COTJA
AALAHPHLHCSMGKGLSLLMACWEAHFKLFLISVGTGGVLQRCSSKRGTQPLWYGNAELALCPSAAETLSTPQHSQGVRCWKWAAGRSLL